jgi:uncharacterized protein
MAKFELYIDTKGQYRWRLKHSNGQTIAVGGEGYTTKRSALAGIASVKKNAPDAEISEAAAGNGGNGGKGGKVAQGGQATAKAVPTAAEGVGRLS